MKRLSLLFACLLALILLAPPVAAQDAMPKTMAYQGYLTNTAGDPANGTTSVTFRLYDQPLSGSALWSERQQGVQFEDGVFAVHLGSVESLEGVLFNRPLWLGVSVDGGQELRPRVALETVPFAMSVRGLRTRPGEDAQLPAERAGVLNLILGHEGNSVKEGVSGAVIGGGGGGENFGANKVNASFGTVGGGNTNIVNGFGGTVAGGGGNRAQALVSTIGGGGGNLAEGEYATVAGGESNKATGNHASIGGGVENRAGGRLSTLSGGFSNRAKGDWSAVGGGITNSAEGVGSTVPGGGNNVAIGAYSFAAGLSARAEHDGSFVWNGVGDTSDPPFISTGEQQFLIRASGGVGIGTNAPQGALHVTNTENQRDLVLGGTEDSVFGDDGVISSDPTLDSSDLWLVSNDAVAVMLDADESGETSEFIVADADLDTVFEVDLTGEVTTGSVALENDLGADAMPAEGGTYRDNVVYAWANVLSDGTVTASYGCTVSKLLGTGSYRVSFKRLLPNGASAMVTVQTLNDPVIATAVTNANQADVATKVFNGAAFVAADYGFYIQVVGRP